MPEDKVVVLGLVSTKRPRMESKELLCSRLIEATRFVPAERLALSPQCGFSTSIVGNRLSVEDQKKKLRLIVETARQFWREI